MSNLVQYNFIQEINYPNLLASNIQQSLISIALDHIDTNGSGSNMVVSIWFKDTLSFNDTSILNTVLASYINIAPTILPASVVINTGLPAFAAKTIIINGNVKNLFKRFTGISEVLNIGTNTFTWTQSSFPLVKFVGIEVIGGELGDNCDLLVLDTATGTYSGHANLTLNQFGFAANIAPNYYKHIAQYDSDINQNLQIQFIYRSVSNKTIYINLDMNEVK